MLGDDDDAGDASASHQRIADDDAEASEMYFHATHLGDPKIPGAGYCVAGIPQWVH